MYSMVLHRSACNSGMGLVNSAKLNCLKSFNSSFHAFAPSRVGPPSIRLTGITILDKLRPKTGFLRNVVKRYQRTNRITINTDVQNNVILYKHNMAGNIIIVVITSALSMLMCAVGSYYTYSVKFLTTLKDFDTVTNYIHQYGVRIGLCFFLMLQSPLMAGIVYMMLSRSVRYAVLHKGGKTVSLTTFHPLKSKRIVTSPVNNISTAVRRGEKTYIPLKIRNRSLFYILDSKGEFINGELYDYTIGTRKPWAV